MENQKIAPKTLLAVLAAQIREDAETIARKIVEEAKGNDIDYSILVENYILKTDKFKPVLFSDFAKKAFSEVNEINKFNQKIRTFEMSLSFNYGIVDETKQLVPGENNEFYFKSEIDEKHEKYDWNLSVSERGSNIYMAFEQFKQELKIKIGHPDTLASEIVIESEIPTESKTE